jgi:hypothetical protein
LQEYGLLEFQKSIGIGAYDFGDKKRTLNKLDEVPVEVIRKNR